MSQNFYIQPIQVRLFVLPDAVLKLTAFILNQTTNASAIKDTLVTHTKLVHLYQNAMELNVEVMLFALKDLHLLNVSVQPVIMEILMSDVKVLVVEIYIIIF